MRYLLPVLCLLAAPALADDIRTVVVSGSAEIMAVPDFARLHFGIETRAQSVDEARRRVDETVSGVTRLMDQLGIPAEHVSTAALVVQPDYQWQQNTRQRELLGYVVTRRMSVRLSDLARLGDTLEGILALGVNQVEPPTFDSTRREELELRVLAEAARNARRRAGVLAQALDSKIADVRHLQAGAPPGIYATSQQSLRAVASEEASSYQPGQIRITAQVTGTFDLATD